MSSADFTLMMAYDRVDPFGAARADLRMGIALASYHNSQHPDNSFVPADFMPFIDHDGPQQSVEEQIAVMERVAAFQAGLKN